jgi:hypothetical protein
MPAGEGSDEILIEQARDRARLLLGAVGGDLDALRAAASDAAYADGAALCEEIAEATRQVIAQLDVPPARPEDTSAEMPNP